MLFPANSAGAAESGQFIGLHSSVTVRFAQWPPISRPFFNFTDHSRQSLKNIFLRLLISCNFYRAAAYTGRKRKMQRRIWLCGFLKTTSLEMWMIWSFKTVGWPATV